MSKKIIIDVVAATNLPVVQRLVAGLNAEPGDERAGLGTFLEAEAEVIGDATVRHTARVLLGEVKPPPLKHGAALYEARLLMRDDPNLSAWDAATIVATRETSDEREQMLVLRSVYRQLKK